jgi:cation diffusion facilitator CzcD-associated flavoprotein CzcO
MPDHDGVIIGAGFSGMYQLHKLRELGFDACVIEAGDDVGGVWYWNRYPGARCDIESIEYSYSFDEKLQLEWDWSERYAAQPELLAYARRVADRFGLREHITFGTRVLALEWDEEERHWTVRTDDGGSRTARHVIAATGVLSMPSRPTFDGIDDFGGELYWTSTWPQDGVDLTGKRVGVIGTGSSGLQTITAIAPTVGSMTVFQRTPCYAVPAHNRPIEADELDAVRSRYPELRAASRMSDAGFNCEEEDLALLGIADESRAHVLERRWDYGGLCFSQFSDVVIDEDANYAASEYVRQRIRDKVVDSAVAAKLLPTFPIATKRMCVDTGYYEVYNQPNVSLVDINEHPIIRLCESGLIAGETAHEFDVIIMATGFDAMTGALNAIDIRNGDDSLKQKWAHGPRTYLGLMSAGFPNLFTVCGPQSPSVLTNMFTSIEQHVDWIAAAMEHMRSRQLSRIEASTEAEDNWVTTNNDLAELTLFPRAASWYMGANIPGKQRIFMPFTGGVGLYRQICDGVATAHYHGFEFA